MARPPARRIDPRFAECDSILFLALFWGGNRLCTLTDLIARYDWVNRVIPTADELDGALNRLLAAGLIAKRRHGFCIPARVAREFDAFRKRRRRDRFVVARTFVESAGPLNTAPRRVTISSAEHERAYAEYQRIIRAYSR
jgi:hypothetical protein